MSILMLHLSEVQDSELTRKITLEAVTEGHLRTKVQASTADYDMTVVFDGDMAKILVNRFGKSGIIVSLADLYEFYPWSQTVVAHKRSTIQSLLEAGDWLYDTLKAIVNGGDPMAAEYALEKWAENSKEYQR